MNLSKVRVAVLGAGKMGGILLQAFLKQQILSPDQLLATVAHPDRAAALSAGSGASRCQPTILPSRSRPMSSCSA